MCASRCMPLGACRSLCASRCVPLALFAFTVSLCASRCVPLTACLSLCAPRCHYLRPPSLCIYLNFDVRNRLHKYLLRKDLILFWLKINALSSSNNIIANIQNNQNPCLSLLAIHDRGAQSWFYGINQHIPLKISGGSNSDSRYGVPHMCTHGRAGRASQPTRTWRRHQPDAIIFLTKKNSFVFIRI